eukprot:6487639-Amphidinium_carterae.1
MTPASHNIHSSQSLRKKGSQHTHTHTRTIYSIESTAAAASLQSFIASPVQSKTAPIANKQGPSDQKQTTIK